MNYAIAVHGRFFAFDLVRALIARNAKVTLLTNYPKWAVARFGISNAFVESFWLHGVASRLFDRLRFFGLPVPEAALHKSFGKWAASRLVKSDANVVLSFSGVSEEPFTALKHTGKQLLLARCSTHIEVQNQILQEERTRSGADVDAPSSWMILREKREYDLANAVVVLSTFARQSFLDRNYPEHRLRLLLLGAELSHFRPSFEIVAERRRRIVAGEPLRVLYVGTLSARKGSADLLQIARDAWTTGSFQFRIVGPIDPQSARVARALRHFADLVPKQPQDKLVSHYAWADIFIFPTLEDGFPVVLAQAQASALPILTTPNCSGTDLIENDKQGWLSPPREPEAMLARLYECDRNRNHLAAMVETLYSTHTLRDWDAVAEDFVALTSIAGMPALLANQEHPIT